MEKNRPHCKLTLVRALAQAGRIRATYAALSGAKSLGMDLQGLVSTVASLKSDDFYKSMTAYNDHRVWQDVYRPITSAGEIYLKLSVIDDVLVISFKKAQP
jgi:motility quorum-sensing regulator/GCU-specific mRNA interferase toxin